jgi:hypothetical protein
MLTIRICDLIPIILSSSGPTAICKDISVVTSGRAFIFPGFDSGRTVSSLDARRGFGLLVDRGRLVCVESFIAGCVGGF